ncbi:MBL fold metallo-hydrolase RNA specificity domain-containing protein [Candidatus Nitrosocosmicus agrestis]|uniref:MBL fold metallo-hydrolase RNA specificity domain-containing protein n=1 Tax=Candidatus Nitrosocosmicus agrestis TaxID=2563600 RepID=UPI00191799CF|nr:MBL fold metallo-hydrolase RNA specificity domain-containing protein [Candidatus Nitrosocosmicus sp. SS]MDR4491118.1 hypothetical protein [Candidatus Nitrosocosmicus sp.]
MRYQVSLDSRNQIFIKASQIKVLLDPKYLDSKSIAFVSHAHSDHLISKSSLKKLTIENRVICSAETNEIAKVRGHNLGETIAGHPELQFINTGHILGSRGLLIENEIFYTGDIAMRDRGFLKKTKIPKVDTLIIESTFGKREYIFPPLQKVVHQVNSILSELYDRGVPVILMGYSLGKAQTLVSLFGFWKPLFVHDEIFKFNKIHRQFGIDLEPDISLSHALENGLLNRKPWVLIYPLTTPRNSVLQTLKKKYGAVTIGFSGWGINKGYKTMMNLDYVIPFSDHCDYNELLEVVRKCNPRKIFTFHGFVEEFSKELVRLGYDAEPITRIHSSQKRSIAVNMRKNMLDRYF